MSGFTVLCHSIICTCVPVCVCVCWIELKRPEVKSEWNFGNSQWHAGGRSIFVVLLLCETKTPSYLWHYFGRENGCHGAPQRGDSICICSFRWRAEGLAQGTVEGADTGLHSRLCSCPQCADNETDDRLFTDNILKVRCLQVVLALS